MDHPDNQGTATRKSGSLPSTPQFRTTLILWFSISPAERPMGRQLRTNIPTPKNQLIPQWSYIQGFREKDSEYKAKKRRDYNDSHRVRPLDSLLPDTPVWIRTERSQTGHIQSPANTLDPTLSPLLMAKSLEELDNALHPGHQYRHVPALEFQ